MILSIGHEEIVLPLLFQWFYIFKYTIIKFCLVIVQHSEYVQHKWVTNNSLLKTVNMSGQTFLKGYTVFIVAFSLVWSIDIVLFKFAYIDNKFHFMDIKTPSSQRRFINFIQWRCYSTHAFHYSIALLVNLS